MDDSHGIAVALTMQDSCRGILALTVHVARKLRP